MWVKSVVAVAATMLAFSSQANAQKFLDRPMTMIIPFAAGGPTDIPAILKPAARGSARWK